MNTRAPIFSSVAMCLLLLSLSWASEPGQPLDCTDWVWLEPGFSCVQKDTECPDCSSTFHQHASVDIHTTTDGHLLALERTSVPCEPPLICDAMCGSGVVLFRHQLVSFDGVTDHVIGYIDERCVDPVFKRRDVLDLVDKAPGDQPWGWRARFNLDNVKGIATVAFNSKCEGNFQAGTSYCYEGFAYWLTWKAELHGLPPLLEIMQTYEPKTSTLSFRVPALPEGLPGADHFDTYYGPLTKPIDFTQAQPLQCAYPGTPPKAGDYLTVEDTLPAPAPGEGRYYVTAVTYQGQTRYGRQNTDGALSGRDPALLPGCDE